MSGLSLGFGLDLRTPQSQKAVLDIRRREIAFAVSGTALEELRAANLVERVADITMKIPTARFLNRHFRASMMGSGC